MKNIYRVHEVLRSLAGCWSAIALAWPREHPPAVIIVHA